MLCDEHASSTTLNYTQTKRKNNAISIRLASLQSLNTYKCSCQYLPFHPPPPPRISGTLKLTQFPTHYYSYCSSLNIGFKSSASIGVQTGSGPRGFLFFQHRTRPSLLNNVFERSIIIYIYARIMAPFHIAPLKSVLKQIGRALEPKGGGPEVIRTLWHFIP